LFVHSIVRSFIRSFRQTVFPECPLCARPQGYWEETVLVPAIVKGLRVRKALRLSKHRGQGADGAALRSTNKGLGKASWRR